MQLQTFAQKFTGLSYDALFVSARLVKFTARDDGTFGLAYWDASLGTPPTDAQIAEAVATPEPAPVPVSVKDYQFAGEAADEGIITLDEAKAWIGQGTVPASLQAAVDKLITDPAQHERVTLFLVGATEFPRYHPNTIALAATFGKDTPAKIDAFFVAAGAR